jgi:hypothetical protein
MHVVAVTMTIVIGIVVASTDAVVRPWHLRVMHRVASDEARALAEEGILVARTSLARTGRFDGIAGARLGRGTIDVAVERASDGDLLVTSSARVPAPLVAGKGGALLRRVRARLRLATGRVAVVEWKEL